MSTDVIYGENIESPKWPECKLVKHEDAISSWLC